MSKKFKSLEELRKEIEKLQIESEDLQQLRNTCEEMKLQRNFIKNFVLDWKFD